MDVPFFTNLLNIALAPFDSLLREKDIDSLKTKAAQGDAESQTELGICYIDGAGVAKDEAEAVKWFRKAADQGHAVAQLQLGSCYVLGEGVPTNKIEAYAYVNLAAVTCKISRELRGTLEDEMTPSQRADGQLRAKKLQAEIEARKAKL
jgi:uncharacterized protein